MGLSSANVLRISQRLNWLVDAFETACGVANVTATTTGICGANEEAYILATADAAAINAMLPAASRLKERTPASNYFGAIAEYLKALDVALGGLNDYLATNALHVSYQLRKAYSKLQVRYVFPPVTDFGSMAVSGSGAGTWTAQDHVDTALYGDGLIEFVAESLIGAASIVATINGTDFDGDAVTTSGTIPNGTQNAATVAIAGAVRFATITTVTFTGGTAADAFRIQTKYDRAAAI